MGGVERCMRSGEYSFLCGSNEGLVTAMVLHVSLLVLAYARISSLRRIYQLPLYVSYCVMVVV